MLEYQSSDAILHHIDPRLKFACVALAGIVSAFLGVAGLGVLCLVACICVPLAGAGPIRTLVAAWPLLLISGLAALNRGLLGQDPIGAVSFVLQILIALFLAESLIRSTSRTHLESVMHRVVQKLPGFTGRSFAFMFSMTLAAIPQLRQEAKHTSEALAMRALPPRRPVRWARTLAGGLLLRIARESSSRAEAAVMRGYPGTRIPAELRADVPSWPVALLWLTANGAAIAADILTPAALALL